MNPRDSSIELRYSDARRRLRNKIRKFAGPPLVSLLLARLQHAEQDHEHLERHLPWHLLLLLKWAFLFAHFGPLKLADPSNNDVNRLMNELIQIEGDLRLPSEYSSVHLFFRAIAHQQFWCQKRPSRPQIARQSLLFRNLPEDHRLRRRYRQLHGIDIPQWLDLSFMLVTGFLSTEGGPLTERYFSTVLSTYPAPIVHAFLSTLSKSPEEVRTYLRALEHATPRDSSEYRELTPLTRYPLLRDDGTYISYYTPLLLRGIETSLYDSFRADDAAAFMDTFGAIFEAYVHRALAYLGRPFLTEQELAGQYGEGKTTDFAVFEKQGVVLIDAKAAEVGHHGMTTHRPEVLSSAAKTSALKGIRQAAALLHRIHPIQPVDSCDVFVLIVTYKQFYLGTGREFVTAIPSDRYAGDGVSREQLERVRPEHIYFVSIDEFEHLVVTIKESGASLLSFLRSMTARNATHEDKRMLVEHHLHDMRDEARLPQYLLDEFDALMSAAHAALEESGA